MEEPSGKNNGNPERPANNRRSFLKTGLKGAVLLTYVTPLVKTVSLAEAQSANSNDGSPSPIGNAPPPPPALSPHISDLRPKRGSPGQEIPVAVHGAHFEDGATVEFESDIQVTSAVVYISSHELHVQIRIKNNANPGSYSVTVVNPDGQQDTKYRAFEVE